MGEARCEHNGDIMYYTEIEIGKCGLCGQWGPVSRHTGEVYWGERWLYAVSKDKLRAAREMIRAVDGGVGEEGK